MPTFLSDQGNLAFNFDTKLSPGIRHVGAIISCHFSHLRVNAQRALFPHCCGMMTPGCLWMRVKTGGQIISGLVIKMISSGCLENWETLLLWIEMTKQANEMNENSLDAPFVEVIFLQISPKGRFDYQLIWSVHQGYWIDPNGMSVYIVGCKQLLSCGCSLSSYLVIVIWESGNLSDYDLAVIRWL